jgi:hypothetical protein
MVSIEERSVVECEPYPFARMDSYRCQATVLYAVQVVGRTMVSGVRRTEVAAHQRAQAAVRHAPQL